MPLSLTRKKSDKMSIKAYKSRIYPHKATTEKLQWVLDRCRELYNAGLQERRDAYEMAVRRHPNYYDDEARKPDKKGIVRVNLKLTKIGTVKLHLHRTIEGTIKTLTIKREGEHFYAV